MTNKEVSMLTPEEELKNIINYKGLPSAPTILKAGINFDSLSDTLTQYLEKTRDTVTLMENHAIMRHIVLQDNLSTIFYYLIVSSNSCLEAREQTISFVADMTMMTMDMFNSGPTDIGEFSIIPMHPEKKVGNLIFFVRNNIGISILVRKGEIDLALLSKQIDEAIVKMKSYDQDSIKSMTPNIRKIVTPDGHIVLNDRFKASIVIDAKSEQNNLLYIFQYDEEMVNVKKEDGPQAVFEAVMPGKTIINCAVVNKENLLSATKSIEITIIEK